MTILKLIEKKLPKASQSELLCNKILVWTEDYEKEWYYMYAEIPEAAQWLWVIKFGKRGKLWVFERQRDGSWKIVQKSDPIPEHRIKHIYCGPAFITPPAPPPVLERNPVLDWWLGSTTHKKYFDMNPE